MDTFRTPLHYAKDGALQFVDSFDPAKDKISLTSFSTHVDTSFSMTDDFLKIHHAIVELEAGGKTSLFDGIASALDLVQTAKGVKVIVILTDGMDNSSVNSLPTIVERALDEGVNIYAIGLGAADKKVLNDITSTTGGISFFTNDAAAVITIYNEISRIIQAYYVVTYTSDNLASSAQNRSIELSITFEDDMIQDISTLMIPSDVIDYLSDREKRREWSIYGGVALILIAGGYLTYTWKKVQKPLIAKLWPNPSVDEAIYLDFTANAGTVQFQHVLHPFGKQYNISNGINRYDISTFPSGDYVITVQSRDREPEVVRFLKL